MAKLCFKNLLDQWEIVVMAVGVLHDYSGRSGSSEPVEDKQLLVEALALNEFVISIGEIHMLVMSMIIMPMVIVVVSMTVTCAEGSHLHVLGQPEHALRSGLEHATRSGMHHL